MAKILLAVVFVIFLTCSLSRHQGINDKVEVKKTFQEPTRVTETVRHDLSQNEPTPVKSLLQPVPSEAPDENETYIPADLPADVYDRDIDPAENRSWKISPTDYSQLIRVDLKLQRLYYYEFGVCLLSASCSASKTGFIKPVGTNTMTPHDHVGIFTIDRKERDKVSNTYHVPMPFSLHFIEGHYIHSAVQLPNNDEFAKIGRGDSMGCVRLMPDVAEWLYSRVQIGCKLEIC